MPTSIVWFRNDLRLADNPALIAGLGSGRPVIPVFVLDEQASGIRPRGPTSRWWLHHSLGALDASLRALGSRLILRRGAADRVIGELARECDASAIYWNRAYEPGTRARDQRIKQAFDRRGVTAEGLKANLLFEPWEITTGSGRPYKVFGAFWRACRAMQSPSAPLPAPRRLPAPGLWPRSDDLSAWRLERSTPRRAGSLGAAWTPGEATALARLADFLDGALARYGQDRDRPAGEATSRLSPHLAFGEIGPRQIWRAVTAYGPSAASDKFLAELGWREFAHSLLFHSADLAQRNVRPEFDRFPWRTQDDALDAWRQGRTGFPIVDAGMRQLQATGWMHNRVRMIAASFLTKHLLIDWRAGERWFWDMLVDADPADNPVNWQWVAGCGADAAPYFRIFNPVLQGEKLDPGGDYVRHWIPELARIPVKAIHRPWTADPPLSASVYPAPIVDHAAARQRALAAYRSIRGG